jgi:hypothetical protein
LPAGALAAYSPRQLYASLAIGNTKKEIARMSEGKVEAFEVERWGKEMDPEEHLGTWDGFMALTKYGTIAVVLILVFMGIFLL